MKKCIYCGKELPDQAAWCPFCEKEQQETKVAQTPVRRRRMLIGCVAAAILLTVCTVWLYMRHRPKVYEGGASVAYEVNGKDCTVFLSFRSNALETGLQIEEFSGKVRRGDNSAIPSQLYVRSDDDPGIQDEFISQVESCSVTASPEDGAEAVEVYGPQPGSEAGFSAAWKADVVYWPETCTNKLCWEVTMKNRDVVRLYQTLTCEELPVITYHYEDTPMDTVEEISALIEKTALEEDPETVLELYLPPVTYEGELVMDKRTAILYGSEEDGKTTTFTDTVRVDTRQPDIAEFYNLEFQGGDRNGTAIVSTDALRVQACLFMGWDIGIDVQNGSWVAVNNAAFVRNRIGFRFDSKKSSFSNPNYENVVFAENETGLQVVNVPADTALNFTGTVFDNNETDVDDPRGLVQLS